MKFILFLFCLSCLLSEKQGKKYEDEGKPAWAKKDIRDYNDADLERLLDQWDEDEEPLPEDELPEYKRPKPHVDLSMLDPSNPEAFLKLSKKGQTLMMFVSVTDDVDIDDTEDVTKLWQSSLWNNHIQAERYVVGDRRVIFMFSDGSQAWDAKDYLVEQEKCAEVLLEQQTYYGKHTEKGKQQEKENSAAKKKNKKQKDSKDKKGNKTSKPKKKEEL